jgi:hypothetical protein
LYYNHVAVELPVDVRAVLLYVGTAGLVLAPDAVAGQAGPQICPEAPVMADMLPARAILQPVMALVLWTLVMWVWLYATRIPAVRRLRVPLTPSQTKEAFNAQLPPDVRWKADNYNHLLEQPTLFYAVALTLAVLGTGDPASVSLAWAYVGLRVVHSLVQATVNVILWRFAVFVLSSLVLAALALRAAAHVLR